jgi:hypothetical protein
MRDTIEMAREAGFMLLADSDPYTGGWWECFDEEIERLVDLVRADEREETNRRANASWSLMCEKMVAAEREACAVIAETPISGEQDDITMQAKDRVAAAIRARENT